MNLSVNIGKLKLQNPVMVASGTFGMEYRRLIDVKLLGAVVTKTVTLKPRLGNPPPRIAETASGMLNSIGPRPLPAADFSVITPSRSCFVATSFAAFSNRRILNFGALPRNHFDV